MITASSAGEALLLAAPEGYLRVFVEEGAPMAILLGKLAAPAQRERAAAAGNVPPDYLARLLAGRAPPNGTSRPPMHGWRQLAQLPNMTTEEPVPRGQRAC